MGAPSNSQLITLCCSWIRPNSLSASLLTHSHSAPLNCNGTIPCSESPTSSLSTSVTVSVTSLILFLSFSPFPSLHLSLRYGTEARHRWRLANRWWRITRNRGSRRAGRVPKRSKRRHWGWLRSPKEMVRTTSSSGTTSVASLFPLTLTPLLRASEAFPPWRCFSFPVSSFGFSLSNTALYFSFPFKTIRKLKTLIINANFKPSRVGPSGEV